MIILIVQISYYRNYIEVLNYKFIMYCIEGSQFATAILYIQMVAVCNCDPIYNGIYNSHQYLMVDNFYCSNFLLSQLYRNIELQIHNVLYRSLKLRQS